MLLPSHKIKKLYSFEANVYFLIFILRGCWARRTTLEKALLIFVVILLLAAIAISASFYKSKGKNNGHSETN